ncbi:MAG: xanthine dehydrogenase family protein molybdopterin-binding subunit, partial [Pseudomonadota bacterium]
RYIGEEVAAVAAVDEETALEALDLIRVDYEPLTPVFDPFEALKEGAPIIHDHAPNNRSAEVLVEHGDIEKGFSESYCVLEERFEAAGLAHCQMEPYASLASYDPFSKKLMMWMPHQSPFTKQKGLSNTLKMPLGHIRVLKSYIGGAFGGRSEVSPADFCAALLSMKCERPVQISYSREENFSTTRLKHPWDILIKLGSNRAGEFMAVKLEIVADGGAYHSTGPIAMSGPYSMLDSIYRIPNVTYSAVRAYTNNPIRGAMKGHGVQQFFFAMESMVDMVAERVGLDPLEIRLKNIVGEGERLNSGSCITSCGLKESLLEASQAARFKEKWNSRSQNKGIGIGCGTMICGFNMGFRSGSTAYVKFNEEGEATLFTGATDNGQGNDSIMVQIAAEELGLGMEDISLVSADTELTPLDPGSYSMCTTFVSANAVRAAASEARRQLIELAAEALEANVLDIDLREKKAFVKGSPTKNIPIKKLIIMSYHRGKPVFGSGHFRPNIEYKRDWLKKNYQEGQMTGAYTFGTAVAEVEVDEETGEVRVLKITAAQDCGFAINPVSVEGQIDGSAGFALGQALLEGLSMDRGQVMNSSFADYGLPTAPDMPEIASLLIESNDPNGPYGAKEAAEAVHPAIIAAIANAVAKAVGIRPRSLPMTPERILELLGKAKTKRK